MNELLVIIFLLVFIVIQEWQNRLERKKLIDAYLAKNLTELKQAEAIDKAKPAESIPDVPEDIIPVDEATDEEFTKAVKKQLGRESLVEKAKARLRNK